MNSHWDDETEEEVVVRMPLWAVKIFAETHGATILGRRCREALERINSSGIV